MIIKNIGQLVGIQPEGVLRVEGAAQGRTGILENAWLRIEDGIIVDFGEMSSFAGLTGESVNAGGGMLIPGFCDLTFPWCVWGLSLPFEFICVLF